MIQLWQLLVVLLGSCIESPSVARDEVKEPGWLISSWHAITLCRNYRFENGSVHAAVSGDPSWAPKGGCSPKEKRNDVCGAKMWFVENTLPSSFIQLVALVDHRWLTKESQCGSWRILFPRVSYNSSLQWTTGGSRRNLNIYHTKFLRSRVLCVTRLLSLIFGLDRRSRCLFYENVNTFS